MKYHLHPVKTVQSAQVSKLQQKSSIMSINRIISPLKSMNLRLHLNQSTFEVMSLF